MSTTSTSISESRLNDLENFTNILTTGIYQFGLCNVSKMLENKVCNCTEPDASGIKLCSKMVGGRDNIECMFISSINDLCEVSGIGKNTAESIYREIHTQ